MENDLSNGKPDSKTENIGSTSDFQLERLENGLFEFFHLSRDIDHDHMFVPRLPKSHAPNEDTLIPRISVAPTIEQCLRGVIFPLWDRKLFVHRFLVGERFIEENMKLQKDLVNLVPDAFISGECWILKEVMSDFIGSIFFEGCERITVPTPENYRFHDIFKTMTSKVNCRFRWI